MNVEDNVIIQLFSMQEGARSHVELFDTIQRGDVDESVKEAICRLQNRLTPAPTPCAIAPVVTPRPCNQDQSIQEQKKTLPSRVTLRPGTKTASTRTTARVIVR